ncbi:hypothetical protein IG631_17016 [Alternaria alternata]|nr:hypothetical protein IG631_17016 [Alternaria alternata]
MVYAPRGRPDHWDDSCLLLRVYPERHWFGVIVIIIVVIYMADPGLERFYHNRAQRIIPNNSSRSPAPHSTPDIYIIAHAILSFKPPLYNSIVSFLGAPM